MREKGPRGFTLNKASRRAGVSVSAPYNHFKDKQALLVEIILQGNRTLEEEVRSAAQHGDTSRERLTSAFLAYIAFTEKHPDLFAVMFQSGIDKDAFPEIRAAASSAFAVGLRLTSEIEAGPEAAMELALAVWTMAHGFAILVAENAVTGMVEPSAVTNTARRLVSRVLNQEQA